MDGAVKSAQRVVEVLQYFAERQDAASAHEIRVALGYPQSSTSILLRSLASLGYLSFDAQSRRYRPTIRVALLGSWIVDEDGDELSPPALMRRLRAATGDTSVLGVQQGVDVVYVHVLQATNPVRFIMKPGSRRPLCTTAVGRALLSTKSDKEIGALVRRINAERTDGTPPLSAHEIIALVQQGRDLGYFQTSGTATPGAGVVAMPILGLREHPPLAIGIGAPVDRVAAELPSYVALLREELGRLPASESSGLLASRT